jgi:GNAT superfamily N-acetyltransferase
VAGDIAVRIVSSWDIDEIAALYKAGGWWKEEHRAEDLPHLIRGSYAFAVAADITTGQAVGMGRIIADGISDAYIQDVVVLPEYRKSGVGRDIVSVLIDHCLQAGITWIALIAEPGTEKFYLPLGFRLMERHVPLLYRGER